MRNVPIIAGAILLADETVGRAASLGPEIEIGARRSDFSFHMAAVAFRRFKCPGLYCGVRQEALDSTAMLTRTADVAWARPILWGLERPRHTQLEMSETGGI